MAAAAIPTQLEVLDLRHFSAAQLKPLLDDEARRWQQRLLWDYTRASATLLEYLDRRILPGFVALDRGRVQGYAFCVLEAAKAVIGDIYAFEETGSIANPVCETLLYHLIELLQATPGIDRIESQLLMFPHGALARPFRSAGFRSCARLFMTCNVAGPRIQHEHPAFRRLAERSDEPGDLAASADLAATADLAPPISPSHSLDAWQPDFYEPAAALIHRCYTGHMDSGINDQYQTLHGSQRFLHNIIRFPGCGVFDPDNSWVLRHRRTRAIEALLLSSRVRSDVAHITQLCVEPGLRGNGLGQHLLAHHLDRIAAAGVKTISLTVTEANAPALALYQRSGFTTLHRFEAMVWSKH